MHFSPFIRSKPLRNTLEAAATGFQKGHSRWGDYSTMSVDPVDDCTFWYTQEYLTTSGDFIWSTPVNHFKLGTCQ